MDFHSDQHAGEETSTYQSRCHTHGAPNPNQPCSLRYNGAQQASPGRT